MRGRAEGGAAAASGIGQDRPKAYDGRQNPVELAKSDPRLRAVKPEGLRDRGRGETVRVLRPDSGRSPFGPESIINIHNKI